MRVRSLLIALVFPCATLAAQGGPPLLTDDPGTPGPGHWEINLAFTREIHGGERHFESPLADVNYGVGKRIQLKVEIPWIVARADGSPSQSGLGNTMVGVKWRFIDRGEGGLAVSTYPQLEVNNPNSSSYHRGLVDRGPALLLPLELTHTLGIVDLNIEGGYEIARDADDELVYGIALGRSILPTVELVAELHETMTVSWTEHAPVWNVGTRMQLHPNASLLLSGGRMIHTASARQGGTLGYAALQLVW